jgi:hypothetical protein
MVPCSVKDAMTLKRAKAKFASPVGIWGFPCIYHKRGVHGEKAELYA